VLSETGNFTESSEAGSTANSDTPLQQRTGYGGRGGAGNFIAKDTSEEERLKEAEARKKEMVEETVRRDVEMALKAPGKAYLAREGL
jgi:hypothetical protein